MQEKKCKDRINKQYKRTIEDYKKAERYFDLDEDKRPKESELEGYEDFFDYVNQSGLSFDYVTPYTFNDQPEGYYRFQMSWGGPSDEFQIFTDANKSIHKIEYWFKDWFDGASLDCTNEPTVKRICESFLDCDKYPHEYLEEETKQSA